MFGKLFKSFMRQVVNIKAHNIPKKLLNIFAISTMLELNYWTKIWTKITQDKKIKDQMDKKRPKY